ncbi:hypothetical protein [Aureimonas jatrophae]|uniref:Uncharacterized protein n=1 Tax=Aureimonas jatrophae TaxID=1166073 RepID=A0A1H0GZX2_9HYPH|nr:hypothetical protein [Aureimonas jatrophae]MBB3949898.1 hypothetical protein [Aureimonas jatrophae]SDO12410.1 hypothetical protein SAMN05192530_103445 [Aureimonas jatrophae]
MVRLSNSRLVAAYIGAGIIGGGVVLPPVKASANTIVAFGHSMINTFTFAMNGATPPVEQNAYQMAGGLLTGLRQLSKGQIDFNRANTVGEGGQQSPYLIANYLAAAVASPAKAALVLAFTNNFRDGDPVSLAQSKADLDTIIAQLRTTKEVIFICDEAPKTTTVTASIIADFAAWRDYARSKHDPSKGIYVLPTWNAIASAPDSNTPAAGMLRSDGIHDATAGVQAKGRACLPIIAAAMPAIDLTARAGVLAGGKFTATGGTLAGATVVPTGAAPLGWSVNIDAAASGSVVSSLDTATGIWRLDIANLANGSSASAISLRGPTSFGMGLALGTDRFDLTMFSKVLAGSQNLGRVSLKLRRNGGQFEPSLGDPAADAEWAGSTSTNALAFDAKEWDALLRPGHALTTAGATQEYPWLDISGFANQALTASIEFRIPQISAYTGEMAA